MTEQTAELNRICNTLQKVLNPYRYNHTLGVMYTASALAMRYGEDMQKALLAGLLHDCGKFCSIQKQKHLCNEYKIELTLSEQQMPALIHAKLGAYLAKQEYHVEDTLILEAIAWHTTGRPGMTLLEKIVYVADFIEPLRDEMPSLDAARIAAFSDIDHAVALLAGTTVSYLRENDREIDPITIKTYEYYHSNKSVF